jgi:hypothetical protein
MKTGACPHENAGGRTFIFFSLTSFGTEIKYRREKRDESDKRFWPDYKRAQNRPAVYFSPELYAHNEMNGGIQ